MMPLHAVLQRFHAPGSDAGPATATAVGAGLQRVAPSPAGSRGLDFRCQKSYKRRIHQIVWHSDRLKAIRGGLQCGGWECDVADIEFPKRPSMLDEMLRRSLTDNFRSGRDSVEPARRAAADEGAANEFDMSNHYEAAMNSGTNINLRKLQEQLDRQPLDEIAMLVRALTYGEMIELAEGMWKVQPEGSAVTQDNLPALLHRWSQSRTVPAQVDYPGHHDPDAE
jgi:hypothetical protein